MILRELVDCHLYSQQTSDYLSVVIFIFTLFHYSVINNFNYSLVKALKAFIGIVNLRVRVCISDRFLYLYWPCASSAGRTFLGYLKPNSRLRSYFSQILVFPLLLERFHIPL